MLYCTHNFELLFKLIIHLGCTCIKFIGFIIILFSGTYVVVEHRDPVRGNWHRAYIKHVDMINETANVYCVDWGINLTIPFNKVRMLAEQFIRLESQVSCRENIFYALF